MTDRETLAAAVAAIPALSGRAAPPRLANGIASVVIDVTGLDAAEQGALEAVAKQALGALAGVESVRVALTSSRVGRTIIAVASGKGGVGKSTVAINLAIALARAGRRTGLVDADIYGPSQARLTGTEGQKPVARDGKLVPLETAWGPPVLSMAHLVAPGTAIAWRGPMTGRALDQLIDAHWGDVEFLVVDLPPGTGDVQMSMVTRHKPVGAVIVSTPQDLALIDAARAIDLFVQAGVPILGLVENMAGYACPACGAASDPFGSGGAEAEARRLGYTFLGRIPLSAAIRSASDAGKPPAASGDGGAFAAIAQAVVSALQAARASVQP